MKIRTGFVSNSSSTSFTFIFKGNDFEDLYTMMRKYDQYFDLYNADLFGEPLHCNVEDIIKAIKEKAKIGSEYESNNPMIITPISKLISTSKETIEQNKKQIEQLEKRNDFWLNLIMDKAMEISDLEDDKKAGFNGAFIIEFGDNHGDICGGDVGNLMDYEGRTISINKPDFIVYTEQNR